MQCDARDISRYKIYADGMVELGSGVRVQMTFHPPQWNSDFSQKIEEAYYTIDPTASMRTKDPPVPGQRYSAEAIADYNIREDGTSDLYPGVRIAIKHHPAKCSKDTPPLVEEAEHYTVESMTCIAHGEVSYNTET